MSPKREMKFQKVAMPKQPPEKRIRNFEEVALGYTPEQAIAEAKRCLQCPKPFCKPECPVEIDIPAFIDAIRQENFDKAAEILRDKNNLPAITGRVCPQEDQCERVCVLSKTGDSIAIGALERFVADYELKRGLKIPSVAEKTGKRVAVVGSGPAGLTVAGDLAKLGHDVTIFEALHTSGGVLVYGIPEFRLPKEVVRAEVNYVKSLGVKIETNIVVGRIITIDELFEKRFDAVFIGTGAGSPRFMGIPGESLNGIYSANEFLVRAVLMKAYRFPEFDTPLKVGKRVGVIGGGNVAMDAARTALRLSSENVTVVYRRSETEIPARLEEVRNAKEEGIQFQLLTNPVRFLGNDVGWVQKMECVRMQLGPPDESGRRRPVPVKDSNFTMEVDTVIVAVGQGPNPLIRQTTSGLQTDEEGYIIVNENFRTSKKGIWAGGDIVPGEATVIQAMGAGKRAARDIDKYVRDQSLTADLHFAPL